MGKKAFTLIELLVVISIIALLMVILVPSVVGARRQAQRIYCLNNLRQLALAAGNYAQNNNDYYPIAQYTWQEGSSITYRFCWDFTEVTESGLTKTVPGLLWEGETIESVHQCPSYKGGVIGYNDPYTGYNYNTSYIGHGQLEKINATYTGSIITNTSILGDISIVMPVKTTQVKKPVKSALFGDGQFYGGANKFMRSPWYWDGDYDMGILRAGGTQGYRHNGYTNVAWCDGHASSQKELYTNSPSKVHAKIESHNATADCKIGFLSPDNSAYDLK
jgi:prepilin-type N-terminal cleavage/methylation domain-containing protein/prepilin-type processing-associated H-X9-DG protein